MDTILDFLNDNKWVLRTLILLGSLLVGFIIEKIIINTLNKIALKTKWKWDNVFVTSLHWMPIIWCVSGGLHYIKHFTDLDAKYHPPITKLLVVVLTFSIAIIIARLTSGTIKLTSERSRGIFPVTTLFTRTTNLLIYLIAGFIILQNLNIEITPLITALGVSGLAVALALQDTLSNLFSGIQIMITQQVRLGDYVMLDSGQQGYVSDIKSRNTTIRSYPDDNRIIIPNSTMVSSIVTNYNFPQKKMWIPIEVGVSYDSDLESVERVSLEVATEVLKEIEGGVIEEKPILRYDTFGDSSINFSIRLYVKEFKDSYLIKHEFIKKLHARYNQEGIEIPFPIRTVHMKNVG
jgi:small-conductance mechanosensitive channel